jgi:hypothetical protein
MRVAVHENPHFQPDGPFRPTYFAEIPTRETGNLLATQFAVICVTAGVPRNMLQESQTKQPDITASFSWVSYRLSLIAKPHNSGLPLGPDHLHSTSSQSFSILKSCFPGMYRPQRPIKSDAGTYGLVDLPLMGQRRAPEPRLPTLLRHGCNMCFGLWVHCAEVSSNTSTFSIKLKAEYLGSQAALSCVLCSVVSKAVDAAEECIDDWPVESVSLHSSLVGGPLDMVVWLINGDTTSFELYTHRGR